MHECLYTSGVWFDSQCLSLFEKGRSIDRPIQMVSNMYACTVDLKHSQVKVNYEETRTGVLIRPYVYIYIYISYRLGIKPRRERREINVNVLYTTS